MACATRRDEVDADWSVVSYARWEWAALAILTGLQLSYAVAGSGSVGLGLAPLAPVIAAFAVLRFGPGVVPAVLVYALLPRLSWNMGPFGVSLAPPALSALLIGAAAGAWWSARRNAAPWQGLWHSGRGRWAVLACGVLAVGTLEWPPMRVPVDGMYLRVAPVGLLAMLALALLPRWRAWIGRAREVGGAPLAMATLLLPPAAVLLSSTNASVNVSGFGLGWGMTAGLPLAVAVLASGLLWVWPSARYWIVMAALVILIEGLRFAVGRPALASAWIDYGRELKWLTGAPLALDGLCNALAAAMAVSLFKAIGPTQAADDAVPTTTAETFGPWLSKALKGRWIYWMVAWLCALVSLVLPTMLGASQAWFLAQDTRGWLVGALAFCLGAAYGLPALTWAPPAMGLLAGAALFPGASELVPVALHGVGVTALVASWCFVGWLVNRTRARPTESRAPSPPARIVPIDGLGRLVHRLDVSATLASFGVLLTVLLVALALVEFGVIGVLMHAIGSSTGEFDWNEDWPMVAVAVLVMTLASLLPLTFLVVDAANRADRMWPVSALTGAVLMAPLAVLGGIVVIAVWGGAATWMVGQGVGRSVFQFAVPFLAGLWATGLLAACAGPLRGAGGKVAAGLLVLLLAGTLWSANFMWAELSDAADRDALGVALQLAAGVLMLGLLAGTLLRAVRLRADLSLPLPRHWLFGEIPGGGFWSRLAALMGLPASMWRLSALREPAFWLMSIARPLVYIGAGTLLSARWWLGLAVILAGHASLSLGKRLAAGAIWRPADPAQPDLVLFLRAFDDDQFDFRVRGWNPLKRWVALWSFRRNLDEALVDEVGRYGRVVALGRPGESQAPFGAARYYARHEDWQAVVLQTARRARAIVIAAGHTPGVLWEYAMLKREGRLERTMLLFHPGAAAADANQAALQAFPLVDSDRSSLQASDSGRWVALLHRDGRWVLLTAAEPAPAHYVLALRLHFQEAALDTLRAKTALLPPPRWPALV